MTFNRKPPPRVRSYPTAIPESQRRNAVFARMDVPAAPPIEKEDATRSEPYRRLVALLPCKVCGVDGYSQAAHPNTGKGAGIKTDDRQCFPLCCDRPGVQGCHPKFDQGALFDKATRQRLEKDWGVDTRRTIDNLGLWPANLPKWTA